MSVLNNVFLYFPLWEGKKEIFYIFLIFVFVYVYVYVWVCPCEAMGFA